jgi:hypothetical protein
MAWNSPTRLRRLLLPHPASVLDADDRINWCAALVSLLRHLLKDVPAEGHDQNSSDGFLAWLGCHQEKIEREKAQQEARRGGGPTNHLPPFRFSDPNGILARKAKTERQGKPIPKVWFHDKWPER